MKKAKDLSVSVKLKSGLLNNIPIILVLSYGYKAVDLTTGKSSYKQVIYYSGLTVDRDEWDFNRKTPLSKEKKTALENIIAEAKNSYQYLIRSKNRDEILYPEELKNELDIRIKGNRTEQVTRKVRIVDFIDQEILATKIVSESRKKAYKTLRNKLYEFEQDLGKTIFSSDFDAEMFRKFMDKERNRDTMNTINAIWSIQKNIKTTLLKIGKKYKIEVFNPSTDLDRGEQVKPEVANTIYFTMDQIKKIVEFEPKDEKMRNTKFILMILIFTGCRESDVYKIKPEFKYSAKGSEFNYAKYISQKSKVEIITPILKPLQWMFDKFNGESPKKVAQQTFNDDVKMLAMQCKLNEEVTISHTDAKGVKQFVTKKFYQFVSSHIGRRSFITNLINYIPIPILTKITGHVLQDNEIIYGYNKISLIENAALFRRLLSRVMEENKDDFPLKLV